MRLEVRKYLFDIQRALGALQEFIGEKSFRDYAGDAMLRAATERQFEIIGEALAQLAKRDPPSPPESLITGRSSRSGIFSSTATQKLMIGSFGTSSRPSCRSCVRKWAIS
jgi:hypothetical protein